MAKSWSNASTDFLRSSFIDASTISLTGDPTSPFGRTTEELRTELREFNTQLDGMKLSWEDERKRLLGENAVLQDATKRLNTEMREAKDELRKYASAERAGEKARAGVQSVSDSCLCIAHGKLNILSRNLIGQNGPLRSSRPS